MTHAVEVEGRRCYVTLAFGHPAKARLQAAGFHWHAGTRRWWATAAKRAIAEDILAATAGDTPAEEDADRVRVVGKAKYKGRVYYVRATAFKAGENRAYVTTLDGKTKFWCSLANPCGGGHDGSGDIAVMLKEYPPHEIRGRKEWMTLGRLRRFAERARKNDAAKAAGTAETKPCWECGREFTEFDARAGGGDWNDSYCGC